MRKSKTQGEGREPAVAAAITQWVRECGSDTDNVRDAAHEASHALEYEVEEWDRSSIDNAVLERPRSEQVASEIKARAVEQLVCEALGVAHDWDQFMFIACMEAMKVGNLLPGPEWLAKAVALAKKRPSVKALADRIISEGRKAVAA